MKPSASGPPVNMCSREYAVTATIRPDLGIRLSSDSVPSEGSPRSEHSTSVSPDSSWTHAVSGRRARAAAIASPDPGTQRSRRNQFA